MIRKQQSVASVGNTLDNIDSQHLFVLYCSSTRTMSAPMLGMLQYFPVTQTHMASLFLLLTVAATQMIQHHMPTRCMRVPTDRTRCKTPLHPSLALTYGADDLSFNGYHKLSASVQEMKRQPSSNGSRFSFALHVPDTTGFPSAQVVGPLLKPYHQFKSMCDGGGCLDVLIVFPCSPRTASIISK